jgi:hypothetical protein
MILSDDKFLRCHAFGGMDFDEIIEAGFLHELPECTEYGVFGGGERAGGAGGCRF